jgi:UDP-glucose 4-epimerase
MDQVKYILVTGGAGYIGSHTVVELTRHGYVPVIADDFRNSNKVVLNGLQQLIEQKLLVHEVDVCDHDAMQGLFEKFSFCGIIHFAAYKAVGESVANPLKYYKNNINALLTIIELALKFHVHNFVFSSSCTVYGELENEKVVTEEMLNRIAISPYGNTKLIAEQILNDVQKVNPSFKLINLRYFNPVGAHPSGEIGEYPIGKPNNLVPFITQTAIGKLDQLTVFGRDYPTADGTCIRDYVHVCDLANAHVKALSFLEHLENGCAEAFNIGTGKGTSVLELIRIFEACTQIKLNYTIGSRRSGDVSEIYASTEKASETLQWSPKFSIQDALLHAWNWEKKLAYEK